LQNQPGGNRYQSLLEASFQENKDEKMSKASPAKKFESMVQRSASNSPEFTLITSKREFPKQAAIAAHIKAPQKP
jgi:hypothetical protein